MPGLSADEQHIMDFTGAVFCAEILAAAAAAERDDRIMAELAGQTAITTPSSGLQAPCHHSEVSWQAPHCLSDNNWMQQVTPRQPARPSNEQLSQLLSHESPIQGSITSSADLSPLWQQHWNTGSTWAYSLGSTSTHSSSKSSSPLQPAGTPIFPNAVRQPATAEEGGCARTTRSTQLGDEEAWWQNMLKRSAARESRGALAAPAMGGDGRPHEWHDGPCSALGAGEQGLLDEPASTAGPVTVLVEDVWAASLG